MLVRRKRRTLSIEVTPAGGGPAGLAGVGDSGAGGAARGVDRAAIAGGGEVTAAAPGATVREWGVVAVPGRQYRLRVLPGEDVGVRVARGELLLTVRDAGRAERVSVCLEHVSAFGLRHGGEFTLRRIHTRWGSLSQGGRLTLNPLLIHAPKECMDYVILHELCHLREFNHSGAFYTLLSRVLPDRKKCRERLNWNG